VSHLLDDAQKNHRRASAIELLELLRGREAHDFDRTATGDESWFHCHYQLREMFAASREKSDILCSDLARGSKSYDHRFLSLYADYK
jgi:hypothetical protein